MSPARFSLPLLALGLAATGCDRTPRAPQPTPADDNAVVGFDNAAASQSVMRPAVLADADRPRPAPPPRALPEIVVGFPEGSALDDAARAALDRLLADEALPADARFVLRGHSDPIGSDSANLAASRRRAEAVAGYLEEKGIAAERITLIALGERRPIAPSANADGSEDLAGQARNRRVEVTTARPPAAPRPDEAADPAANTAAGVDG